MARKISSDVPKDAMRPFLLGMICAFPFFLMNLSDFVFSPVYGHIFHHLCKATATLAGVSVHLLSAALISGVFILRKGAKRIAYVVIGAATVLFSAFVILLGIGYGEQYPVAVYFFDGFLYEKALGIKVYIDYFGCEMRTVLSDTPMFFFWLTVLSVVAAEKKPTVKDFVTLCVGGAVGTAVLTALCIAVGQTEYWEIVHFYDMPEYAETGISVLFALAMLLGGLRLIIRQNRISRKKS